MSSIPGGEYNIPDSTAKSDWEAHNKKQEEWYQGILAQFMQIAGGLMFDADGNPVIDEATGKQKINPDAAGAAITFFVMVLGQAMMEKQGSKIAESADQIAYMEGYLKAVTHLKQLFSEAESCTDPVEKAALTAQFNKELDNFLNQIEGKGMSQRDLGPMMPKDTGYQEGVFQFEDQTSMNAFVKWAQATYPELKGKIEIDTKNNKVTISGDVGENFDALINAALGNGALSSRDQVTVNSKVGFMCNDNQAFVFKKWLEAFYPDLEVEVNGNTVTISGIPEGSDLINQILAGADNEGYLKHNYDWQSNVENVWFDSDTVNNLRDAINDLKNALSDRNLTDIWDNSKAKDGKEPVDAGALKKFMNAFDTMGTMLSSISQAVQQEIQFDQGEFNKFLEIVHNMGSEVNKLLESINRKSGR